MSVDDCFLVPEDKRKAFISKNIVSKLNLSTDDERKAKEEQVAELVNQYMGQDVNALSLLAYAAERGKLDEYTAKMKKHYDDSLQFVHPEARRLQRVPGAVLAEQFFLNCYTELGIKPSK